jgi:membrane protein
MTPTNRLLKTLRSGLDAVPGLGVVVQAVRNYISHQSGNQAGSVAFSSLLSMFPLLLFLAAAAAYVGQPGTAARMVRRVMEYAPPLAAEVLQPAVDGLLLEPNRVLLTFGIIVTIWTASSGVQAIRTALNRAYGVTRGLSFWRARIKVTVFTIVGTIGLVIVFSSVVVLPYVQQWIQQVASPSRHTLWLLGLARYGVAYLVLAPLYATLYGYLPDVHQRLRTVLPGALVGALLWLMAALALSSGLRGASNLTLVYGSFAGMVATLVFLYASAATLIFGAEINAVLREREKAPEPTTSAL